MKQSLLLVFFAAAALAAQPIPPATQLSTGAPALKPHPNRTKFTFVVAGDNRPKKATDPLTQPFLDLVGRLVATPPAFVVWNGDTVFGKKAPGLKAEYDDFLHALNKLPVPVFNAPGNHELVVQTNIPCGQWSAELPDYSGAMPAEYVKKMGSPYGVFRYGNAAFILLNTDDVPDVAIPTACDYNGFIGATQLAALQTTIAQLSSDPSVAHIFFFMHRPIHDDNGSQIVAPAGSDYATRLTQFRDLIDTNANSKVTFVFASHDHRLWVYPPPPDLNGPFARSVPATTNPTFIVTGGAGAPLEGCPGNAVGAYFHYISVSVDGANVSVNVVPLYGTTPCATAAAPQTGAARSAPPTPARSTLAAH